MTTRTCNDPADGLLPWYVNGTLDREEAASVARHLEGCSICARKCDELAEIAESLSAYGMPAAEARRARTSRLPYALAAGLLLPAVLGVYWAYLGFPTRREVLAKAGGAGPRPPQSEPLRSTMTLDLGPGPLRGEEAVPTLHLSDSADWITVRFFLPTVANPLVAVDLETGAGKVLAQQSGIPGIDELGRSACSFPRELLRAPGEYAIVVREESSSEGPRDHRFPFRVEGPARSGER